MRVLLDDRAFVDTCPFAEGNRVDVIAGDQVMLYLESEVYLEIEPLISRTRGEAQI